MMEFDLAVAARFRKSGGGHRQVRKKRRLIILSSFCRKMQTLECMYARGKKHLHILIFQVTASLDFADKCMMLILHTAHGGVFICDIKGLAGIRW
jgi:hypothetical protein